MNSYYYISLSFSCAYTLMNESPVLAEIYDCRCALYSYTKRELRFPSSEAPSLRFSIWFPKLKSILKPALQTGHFLMLAWLPWMVQCVKLNKKTLPCIVGNCRTLFKSSYTFVRSVFAKDLTKDPFAKELVSDWAEHLLIVGQCFETVITTLITHFRY